MTIMFVIVMTNNGNNDRMIAMEATIITAKLSTVSRFGKCYTLLQIDDKKIMFVVLPLLHVCKITTSPNENV